MRSGQLRGEWPIAIVNLPNITSVPHAVGAAIGGKRTAVMIQNTGFGNAVSPLTSLTHVFGSRCSSSVRIAAHRA